MVEKVSLTMVNVTEAYGVGYWIVAGYEGSGTK